MGEVKNSKVRKHGSAEEHKEQQLYAAQLGSKLMDYALGCTGKQIL
jgi:hypothetical protein